MICSFVFFFFFVPTVLIFNAPGGSIDCNQAMHVVSPNLVHDIIIQKDAPNAPLLPECGQLNMTQTL